MSVNKIDPNLTTADELAALPGIGEVLAARIVEYRDAAASARYLSGSGTHRHDHFLIQAINANETAISQRRHHRLSTKTVH